ncbi:hypothetical protein AMTRI_Chr04g252780 [Amborella trichopoda]
MLTPHIGNLSFLQVLNLRNNSFHGSIPPQIGHLYRLQALVISRNQLEGSIPKEMGLLPNIKGLYLEGTIPPSLGNISTLEEIWLYENLIHGSIPDEIGLLSGITILNFHANNFTGPIPSSLFNMSSLIYLVLYSNDFSGSLPTNMGSMLPNLEELYLWSNQLSGQIPSSLYNASKLTVLELQKNQFNGPVPTSLGHLTALKVLKLNSNHLENGPVSPNLSFIDSLTNCTFLEYLQLGDNLFAGFLPDSIGNLSNNLKTFTLNGCHIKGSIPASIGNLQNLTGLDLRGNSISGRLPSEISRLHKIGALLLSGNKLEGSIPTEFGQLQSLLYLYLNDNMLSGSMPPSINNLTKICDLNLGNNKLSGELPTGIWSEALLEVDLSRNYFSSLLPQLMGHSIMLTQVNFSDNHLFGNLPNSMGNLQRHELSVLSDGVSQMKGPGWISYYELRRATDNFNRSTLLGVGSFGSVYKGFLSDGSPAAIKVLNLQREGATKSFHAECRVMQNIRHRNLVKIITVCSNLDFKALVLQFMANGNLERWLNPQDGAHCRLSLLQRLDIVIDVAQALEYLHHSYSVPIIHRDLKPSNILLNEDMTAHVGDFGLARLIGDQNIASQTSTIGTIGYIAPEYGTGSNITTSGDVYSFGVVLFEIFTRKRPTDPMFSNGLSLSKWVDQEHSDGILEVVHGDLLLENDSHNNGSNSKLQYSSSTFKCLSSVMQIGLSCTKERPNERIDMRDAVLKLKDTRSEYMAILRA